MNLKFRVWNRALQRYEEFASLLTESCGNGTLKIIGIQDGTDDFNEQLVDYDLSYGEGVDIEFYTGLKDKSGDEIYEGDILLKIDLSILLVYYSKRTCNFTTDTSWLWSIASDSKIIGNIHENPELLEGERK